MSVPSNLANWSATESQNYPAGSDIASGVIDNICRQIQATVRRYLAFKGTTQAASALDLSTADGSIIEVSGSGATISSLGTVAAGMVFKLRMQDANTFVHSANLVCPGGTNILTAAGDILEFTSAGSGVWWLTDFQPGTTSVGGVPVGVVVPYGGTAAPTGWLLCYGQAVSRSTYAGLFATIGTAYGAGDGSTTFNVPDLRGRVPAGKDDMGGSAASRLTAGNSGITGATLGAAGGDERLHGHTHTGTTGNENSGHTHSGTTGTESANHQHGFNGGQGVPISTGQLAGQEGAIQTYSGYGLIYATDSQNANHTHSFTTGGVSANHTHSFTSASTGGGSSQNVQPTLVTNYIIRA